MTTFLVDKRNDLVASGGELNIIGGVDGALLAAKHYAQTLRGEMMHDMQSGIRFLDTAFNEPRLQLFEMDFRNRVEKLPDVVSVTNFDARIANNELIYSATILTRFGAGTITNG